MKKLFAVAGIPAFLYVVHAAALPPRGGDGNAPPPNADPDNVPGCNTAGYAKVECPGTEVVTSTVPADNNWSTPATVTPTTATSRNVINGTKLVCNYGDLSLTQVSTKACVTSRVHNGFNCCK